MKLYTIGFTQKRAEEFFGLLRRQSIQRLADIRLHPSGQLSGFTRQSDLPYFLHELATGCEYVHLPMLAPTDDILKAYRQDHDWPHYALRFEQLMDERNIPQALNQSEFEAQTVCLLCSEATPECCHRRLVAERLAAHWLSVEVIHL